MSIDVELELHYSSPHRTFNIVSQASGSELVNAAPGPAEWRWHLATARVTFDERANSLAVTYVACTILWRLKYTRASVDPRRSCPLLTPPPPAAVALSTAATCLTLPKYPRRRRPSRCGPHRAYSQPLASGSDTPRARRQRRSGLAMAQAKPSPNASCTARLPLPVLASLAPPGGEAEHACASSIAPTRPETRQVH